jgi:hypothetical protein
MVKAVAELLMAAEANALCGAPYRQPSEDRVNWRNGYRERRWDTRVGTIDLAILKLRKGSYFPDWLLEPRRRAERALMQAVTECYVRGVSTRRVDGYREILGFDVFTSEDEGAWTGFLRGLVARGLSGVKLVTSDPHSGLKAAIARELPGSCWQRCRTHFMRNLLSKVPKSAHGLVATLVRSIFAQPTDKEVWAQHERVCEELERRFPQAAQILREAAEDILAFTTFPQSGSSPIEKPSSASLGPYSRRPTTSGWSPVATCRSVRWRRHRLLPSATAAMPSWRRTSSRCWSSSSLLDHAEDGAMPLHHLTGRGPATLSFISQLLNELTNNDHLSIMMTAQ